MDTCTELVASRASLWAARVSRKAPAETIRVEHDVSDELDCAAVGVTITSSTWAIDTDDDDGTLTLGVADVSGLITRQPVSGGTAGKDYRLHNVVQSSDGLELTFTTQLPVRDTRAVV